jgi:hypothetical protein
MCAFTCAETNAHPPDAIGTANRTIADRPRANSVSGLAVMERAPRAFGAAMTVGETAAAAAILSPDPAARLRASISWSRLWEAARCHDATMLELRPTCENCNRPLPRDAPDAMICTIECTFCRDCVETVLSNVCPNCGGGFERRPVRPAQAWVEGAPQFPPPSTKVVHKPVDPATQAALVASVGGRPPSQR